MTRRMDALRADVKRAARAYIRARVLADGGVDFERRREVERDIADAWSIEINRLLPRHLRGRP